MSSYIKYLGSMAILLLLLAFPVSASMVSFQLVETGLNDRAVSGQHTRLWESGLMSVFFDAGYIVTSGPITRMENKTEADFNGLIELDFNEAIRGGADYFIVGLIAYNTNMGRATPVSIVLQVYDSNSRQLIHEQNFAAGGGRNDTEELQLAQNAGRIMISYIRGR